MEAFISVFPLPGSGEARFINKTCRTKGMENMLSSPASTNPPIATQYQPSPSITTVSGEIHALLNGDPYSHHFQLIHDLSHLCNITTSGLNAWLSLEVLARQEPGPNHPTQPDATADTTTSRPYHLALHNQTLILGSMTRNLEHVYTTLLSPQQEPAYRHYYSNLPGYRSLLDAAFSVSKIVHEIPGTKAAGDGTSIGAVDGNSEGGMPCLPCLPPSMELVKKVRSACNEMTDLCHGDVRKGWAGWRACFQVIMGG